jgi:hypothetical protein
MNYILSISSASEATFHDYIWTVRVRADDGHTNGDLNTNKRIAINLLKTKRNLLYIRNQSVPRCKHFPPRL